LGQIGFDFWHLDRLSEQTYTIHHEDDVIDNNTSYPYFKFAWLALAENLLDLYKNQLAPSYRCIIFRRSPSGVLDRSRCKLDI